MNFENTEFRQEVLDLTNPFDVKLVSGFLKPLGFEFNVAEVDFTLILYTLKGDIIGTGSHRGRILKYVAVSPKYRDSTAFALVVTALVEKVLSVFRNVYVFTRPSNAVYFKGLGFKEIAVAKPLFCALEFGYETIANYQDYLKSVKMSSKNDKVAAIVVNCNPFTMGHRYLIEKAASENELVYLFVVEEDHSVFPFVVRWELISKGIAHLNNVVMVKGGDYIVSGSIFPAYFLKNELVSDIMKKQAELDVSIFANYVVPVLGIKKRYVGTENYCKTTAAYNVAMHKILPAAGVEVIEIERIVSQGDESGSTKCISASLVREAIKNDTLDAMLSCLPEPTRDFLLSEESGLIREKIKNSNDRH
jgi:[citrate (pro-3S)-lyase] ligase